MATERCLNEIVTKYACTIGLEELSSPEDKIICIVNYIQYSEEASEMNSFPESLYDRFYYLLGTICESKMVLQQCVYQLIFMLHLREEIADELVDILFGKDKEYFLYGDCLFNKAID
jgi:hypothetical protein